MSIDSICVARMIADLFGFFGLKFPLAQFGTNSSECDPIDEDKGGEEDKRNQEVEVRHDLCKKQLQHGVLLSVFVDFQIEYNCFCDFFQS